MARHLLLISLGLTLALATGSAEAVRPRPDCSNTFTNNGVTILRFKEVCAEIYDVALFQVKMHSQFDDERIGGGEGLKPHQDPMAIKKLDLVESCACILLNHELGWASLMSHELMVFYEAIKQFIDNYKNPAIEAITTGPTKVFFEGEEGKRRFYWDTLDFILGKAGQFTVGNMYPDAEEIYRKIATNISELYYDHAFKLMFVGKVETQALKELIKRMCLHVNLHFGDDFMPLFNRLTLMSGNPHYFFLLTAYNEDLFKLRMVYQACSFLKYTGQLPI